MLAAMVLGSKIIMSKQRGKDEGAGACRICRIAHKSLGANICAGIGRVYGNAESIHTSFLEAKDAFHHRIFVGENQALTLRAASEFLKEFVSHARQEHPKLPLRVLGPSPALVVKVSNKYRYKLIIKCKNNKEFRALLTAALLDFGSNREFAKVTAYADMNALVC